MIVKKISGWLHLWLGLVSGLVVLIVAVTGAIYEFQPEITKLTQPYLTVKAEDKLFLPISDIKAIALKQLPNKQPIRIILKGKTDAAVVLFFAKKPEPYYYNVYINPYTGKVLSVKNMREDFFTIILAGHMHLWLPETIGAVIVAYATLIFLLIIITGIILWWPRNKARLKTSFKVKWNASPKRLNYDLHNVLGFYASWIILFAVLTALVWCFQWAANAEYWLVSGGKTKPKLIQPKTAISAIDSQQHPLNVIIKKVTQAYPKAAGLLVSLPAKDSAAVVVRVYPNATTFYQSDNLYFNQYTAEAIPVKENGKYAQATAGEKAVRMNYDIHVGAIAGLPGRIAMFLASLVVASLPVTGFIIWWGKRKKKK